MEFQEKQSFEEQASKTQNTMYILTCTPTPRLRQKPPRSDLYREREREGERERGRREIENFKECHRWDWFQGLQQSSSNTDFSRLTQTQTHMHAHIGTALTFSYDRAFPFTHDPLQTKFINRTCWFVHCAFICACAATRGGPHAAFQRH